MKTTTLLLTSTAVLTLGAQAQVFHPLSSGPLLQDWSNAGAITANDDWSGVASIRGFRGDNLALTTGVDPSTILDGDDTAPVLDIIANQVDPNTVTSGGVAEFDALPNPTVALNGSGTADAPYLSVYLNTVGVGDIRIQLNLRDIDGSTDNSTQQFALQYRIGSSGLFANIPSGYFGDVSTGPSATQSTPVDLMLPADAENHLQVQIRFLTSNAIGNDEWIGIDDIQISATPVPEPQRIAVIAGFGLIALAAWRRRLTAKA